MGDMATVGTEFSHLSDEPNQTQMQVPIYTTDAPRMSSLAASLVGKTLSF